ncbi:MAG: transcriptional regulator [Oscillospiraceae bacterium]|nr:transcriptional regulator [Oscillospiraceae bacterium]
MWVSVLSAAAIAAILLRKWVWPLLKLAGKTALGGGVLLVLSRLGWLGLGANLLNAAVLGALGAPGFALLLALQWLTA